MCQNDLNEGSSRSFDRAQHQPPISPRECFAALLAYVSNVRGDQRFALGIPIRQATRAMKVTFAQGELVEGTVDSISYAFGVCPSGRIFRIESSQPLGRFAVDKTFTDQIGAKLFAKYGAATGGAPDNFHWDLVEPVRYTDGKVHSFKTNWAAAM